MVISTFDLCPLCQKSKNLRRSHIISKFVERLLKGRSLTGALTKLEKGIRKKAQSLDNYYLLCKDCEALLGRDEDKFSKYVFWPYWKDGLSRFRTGDWAYRFALGLCFRTALHVLRNHQRPIPERMRNILESSTENWRYILMRAARPRQHQGFYIWAYPIPPNERGPKGTMDVGEFVLTASKPDVYEKGPLAFVAAHLPGFLVLGGLFPRAPIPWEPIRITEDTQVIETKPFPDACLESLFQFLSQDIRGKLGFTS